MNEGGRPVSAPIDEVSIALDSVDGRLMKHGNPVKVQAWVDKEKRNSIECGYPDMMANVVVLTGRFKLGDLNRCLDNAGFAQDLYRRAIAGELAEFSFAEAVQGGTGGESPSPSALPFDRQGS